MDQQQWDVLQGQIEGLGVGLAMLAGHLNGAGLVAARDYAQQLVDEAGRVEAMTAHAQLAKSSEVLRSLAGLVRRHAV